MVECSLESFAALTCTNVNFQPPSCIDQHMEYGQAALTVRGAANLERLRRVRPLVLLLLLLLLPPTAAAGC